MTLRLLAFVFIALSLLPSTSSTDDTQAGVDDACLLQKKSQGGHAKGRKAASLVSDDNNESVVVSDDSKDDAGSNSTSFIAQVFKQIEFELSPKTAAAPKKNKLILLLIEFICIGGCCGIDRCYMGQTCLGIAKGLTFGGFLIWAFIDWWVVVVNAIEKFTSINTFGFAADFERDTIDGAFYLSCAMIATFACTCCCSVCLGKAAQKG